MNYRIYSLFKTPHLQRGIGEIYLPRLFAATPVYDEFSDNPGNDENRIDLHVFIRAVVALALWSENKGRRIEVGGKTGVQAAGKATDLRWFTQNGSAGSQKSLHEAIIDILLPGFRVPAVPFNFRGGLLEPVILPDVI